jgi:hypothetical protein
MQSAVTNSKRLHHDMRQPLLGSRRSIDEVLLNVCSKVARKFPPQQATDRGNVQHCSERARHDYWQ